MSASLFVPVVKSNGEPKLDHMSRPIEMAYVNTPFKWLFPQDDVILIQMASRDDASVPVCFGGETYFPYYGWGMSAKNGVTVGMQRDLLAAIAQYAQDSIRFSRWAMPQGWYGSRIIRPKIALAPRDSLYNGLPIGDGFGYIKKSLANTIYNRRTKIRLNRSKGSYTFWQRIPWSDELENELMPYINRRCADLGNVQAALVDLGQDEKEHLIELEQDMAYHPYCANALQRSMAEYLARCASTVGVGARMKLAVPSTVAQVACLDPSTVLRYPSDSYGSQQAVGPCDDPAEVARIAGMECIQYSLSNHEMFAKGVVGIVENLDVDLVLCEEDVKMGSLSSEDLCFTSLQHFAKGSALGVNMAWFKDTMAGDGDGDLVEITNCKELPVLWETVRSLPDIPSEKVNKKRTPISDQNRIDFLSNSFSNLVGIASDHTSNILAVADQDWLAGQIGSTSAKLHKHLMYLIHNGTDFKADVDRKLLEDSVRIDRKRLSAWVPKASWTNWPNDWAFVHGLPKIADRVQITTHTSKIGGQSYSRTYFIAGEEVTDENEIANIISPEQDGTIAQIYRLMYPALEEFGLDYACPVRPLSAYLPWAEKPEMAYLEWAYQFQVEYDERRQSLNESDPDAFQSFKAALHQKASAFQGDRWKMANALWIVGHSKVGRFASAALVFMLFPEACELIITQEPGLAGEIKETLIAGVKNQVDDLVSWSGEVEIVDFNQEKGGKVIVRKSLVAHVSASQRQAQGYPEGHLGVVVRDTFQPECGRYHALITRNSAGSWKVVLG